MNRCALVLIFLLANTASAQAISSNLQGYGKICSAGGNIIVDRIVLQDFRDLIGDKIFTRLFLNNLTSKITNNFNNCKGKDLRIFFDFDSYYDYSISRYVYIAIFKISPFSSTAFDFKSIWNTYKYGTANNLSELLESFDKFSIEFTDMFTDSWKESRDL